MLTRFTAMLIVLLAALPASAGPLDPPVGPISPTARPLAEIEPRTLINAANTPGDADSIFRITQPGSYYLGANIDGVAARRGIEIASDNVSIDLNGFTLRGVPGSLAGIASEGLRKGITIRNGIVRAWGAGGINLLTDNASRGCSVEDVIALNNTGDGIRTAGGSVVRRCIAADNTRDGMFSPFDSVIDDCLFVSNDRHGLYAPNTSVITHTVAGENGAKGFYIESRGNLSACVASLNVTEGFELSQTSTLAYSVARSNGLDGIRVGFDNDVLANNSSSNGFAGAGAGILLFSIDSRIQENHCNANDYGIRATQPGNFISRNSAGTNTISNWNLVTGNIALVASSIGSPAGIGGTAGGTAVAAPDPNINITN